MCKITCDFGEIINKKSIEHPSPTVYFADCCKLYFVHSFEQCVCLMRTSQKTSSEAPPCESDKTHDELSLGADVSCLLYYIYM